MNSSMPRFQWPNQCHFRDNDDAWHVYVSSEKISPLSFQTRNDFHMFRPLTPNNMLKYAKHLENLIQLHQ